MLQLLLACLLSPIRQPSVYIRQPLIQYMNFNIQHRTNANGTPSTEITMCSMYVRHLKNIQIIRIFLHRPIENLSRHSMKRLCDVVCFMCVCSVFSFLFYFFSFIFAQQFVQRMVILMRNISNFQLFTMILLCFFFCFFNPLTRAGHFDNQIEKNSIITNPLNILASVFDKEKSTIESALIWYFTRHNLWTMFFQKKKKKTIL